MSEKSKKDARVTPTVSENIHVKRQRDLRYGALLGSANSMPEYQEALRGLIEEALDLDASEVDRLVDVMASPVAYALTERAERARHDGAHDARQAVASRLDLGDLVKEERR